MEATAGTGLLRRAVPALGTVFENVIAGVAVCCTTISTAFVSQCGKMRDIPDERETFI
jgi:hypothetical protein